MYQSGPNGLLRPLTEGREEERFEYAASLIKLGSANEAHRILQAIPFSKIPMVARQLYLATVRLWTQEEAVPLLKQYLEVPGLERAQFEIARIELADAYYYGLNDTSTALSMLEESWRSLESYGSEPWIKLVNAQIRLQTSYAAGDSKQALECIAWLRREFDIDRLNRWVSLEARMYELLIQAQGATGEQLASYGQALSEVRRGFQQVGRWEFARQCDALWAIQCRDPKLLARVYHLSPIPAFRKKLLAWAKPHMDVTFLKNPESRLFGAPGFEYILDLSSGWLLSAKTGRAVVGKKMPKFEGQLPQRLLSLLTADAYRVPSLIELHEIAYPDARFSPTHGASRVKMGITRLRRWMETIPALEAAKIEENDLRYRFELPPNIAIRADEAVETPRVPMELAEKVAELKELLEAREFSPAQAQKALQQSTRSISRLLSDAAAAGALVRVGAGRSTRYRFQCETG